MDRHCRRAKTILAAVQFDGFTDEDRAALACYLDRMSQNLQMLGRYYFPGNNSGKELCPCLLVPHH